MTSQLLDAALSYARKGWAVLPLHYLKTNNTCSCGKPDCTSPGKHPASANGTKDATTDEAIIRDWWRKIPKCHVGIATGSASGGLVVVDFDERHGGIDSLRDLNPPMTLVVETGNGFHFYYQGDGSQRNSAELIAAGVDTRGEGGYVVAPPSRHVSGRDYRWDNQEPIVAFPQVLADRIKDAQQVKASAPDDEIIVSDPTALSECVTSGRNNFLTQFAGRLHNAGLAEPELYAALRQINASRCQPPLSDREVSTIAHSVSRYPVRNPLPPIQPQTTQAKAATPQQPQADPDSWDAYQKSRPQGVEVLTVADLINTIYPPESPILRNLYPGMWGLIVGHSNLGKSALSFNLAISLACGRPFEPITPDKVAPRKILYLDYEQRRRDLQGLFRRMLSVLTPAEQVLVEQNLHFICPPEYAGGRLLISETAAQKFLAEFLKKEKYDACFIDTFSQASWLTNENDNSEVQRKIVTPLQRIGEFSGCCIIGLHHEGKGDKGEESHSLQYSARGASALVGGARWVLNLKPTVPSQKNHFRTKFGKEKGDGEAEWHEFEIDKNRWCMRLTTVTVASAPKTLRDLIIEHASGTPDAFTIDDLALCFIQHTRSAIKMHLSRLVTDGVLIRDKKGSYRFMGVAQP